MNMSAVHRGMLVVRPHRLDHCLGNEQSVALAATLTTGDSRRSISEILDEFWLMIDRAYLRSA